MNTYQPQQTDDTAAIITVTIGTLMLLIVTSIAALLI